MAAPRGCTPTTQCSQTRWPGQVLPDRGRLSYLAPPPPWCWTTTSSTAMTWRPSSRLAAAVAGGPPCLPTRCAIRGSMQCRGFLSTTRPWRSGLGRWRPRPGARCGDHRSQPDRSAGGAAASGADGPRCPPTMELTDPSTRLSSDR
jgi:hypothetical protein